MGNCVSGGKQPPNFFSVKNINEDKNLVQRGLLEVNQIELIYTDSASADKWTWPLRYLRKYGCDGEVFSFEAGRKCPGGEGLYAFSSRRASKIFELVARNINQGEQQQQAQNGEVSPYPSETRPPDLATMSFVRPQTPPNPRAESNYTNIGQDGIPLAQAEQQQALPPEPPKGQYIPVDFSKSPSEHPAPQPNPDNPPTSYTQIDFEKTERMTRDRIQGTLLEDGISHRTTGSVSIPPQSRTHNHRHRRLNTVSSGTSHNRRSSESSYSSQSSLTESSRNLTSPQVNGHALGSEPGGVTYQNVALAQQQAMAGQQGLYQNVNIKPGGNVSDVFNESRYANMDYQSRHHSVANGNGLITPIRVNGMGTYADVVPGFRNRATSTPIAQDSYTQLEFSRDKTPSTADSILSPSSSAVVPQPSLNGHTLSPDASSLGMVGRDERAGSNSDQLPPTTKDGLEIIDENRVTYGTLNFPAMAALSETSREREQELSANNHVSSDRLMDRESRERKTSTSLLFKRSHKDKEK